LLGQQSALDQYEVQAIRSISAARKMKKEIERQGMRADTGLQSATLALKKVVNPGSQAQSDLLQLDEHLQVDERDDQPIIELVVSDFGGPPPHKRLHRTDGKKKHHHKHHHSSEEEEKEKEKAEKERKDKEEQSEGDVDTKQFDPEDLAAYTANAVNSNFNEVRRKGLGARSTADKSIDLATSLSEASQKPAVQATQSLSETEKSKSTVEDSVAQASSQPTVKQVDESAESSAAPSATAGENLSQASSGKPESTPNESKPKIETPKPQAVVEPKKESNAPLAPSKLETQIAQHEKENAIPERF